MGMRRPGRVLRGDGVLLRGPFPERVEIQRRRPIGVRYLSGGHDWERESQGWPHQPDVQSVIRTVSHLTV